MKRLIISGSSKLYERALYWRGYFDGRGYEVIDWPCPITDDPEIAERAPRPGFLSRILHRSDDSFADNMTKTYQRYWRNLDQADVFFLMNEDRDGIEGYIGASAFSELNYAVVSNLVHNRKIEIYLLKVPSESQPCYPEVKFWLDQGYMSIFRRSGGRKPASTKQKRSTLLSSEDKTLDITHCRKKALNPLSTLSREYLKILCPEFPAWLLPYIAAPEFQRLDDVSMTTLDYSGLENYPNFNSVFAHSIGTALIVWNFTHDKKQTLAALFHDIASPSFKHAVDYYNGDSETQESIESGTGDIIRNSRTISRQLKRDGILASEISDYHLYPIADNDIPGLAADRLEYTFSNGYFLYELWTLEDIKRLYESITVLKNENGLDELGFRDPATAAEFTLRNLTLSANYHAPKARITLQFFADMIRSMINAGYLTLEDLFTMSEREVIDWILSCGDHTLAEVFRNFQRTTTVSTGSTAKKNVYNTSVRCKIRYIDPLVYSAKKKATVRITSIDREVAASIKSYLSEKMPKYVSFDFDFKPYTE